MVTPVFDFRLSQDSLYRYLYLQVMKHKFTAEMDNSQMPVHNPVNKIILGFLPTNIIIIKALVVCFGSVWRFGPVILLDSRQFALRCMLRCACYVTVGPSC